MSSLLSSRNRRILILLLFVFAQVLAGCTSLAGSPPTGLPRFIEPVVVSSNTVTAQSPGEISLAPASLAPAKESTPEAAIDADAAKVDHDAGAAVDADKPVDADADKNGESASAQAGEGEENEGETIEAYFEYRFDQMKDESGSIPDGALMQALNQRATLVKQQASRPQPNVAGIDNVSWTFAGPGNIGGRIRAILPISATTVFIGGVSGGLWKTTNCCSTSTTWSPINDWMSDLAISSLIVDPTNANVMYAGTGEGFYNIDAVRGAGVFQSTDGGNTWAQLSNTNNSNFNYVNRLAIASNASYLLAATNNGIYRSADGGTTWSHPFSTRTMDLRTDPANINNAVAGASGNAYYSTNGGVTWNAATGISNTVGRIELAYAPSNSSIVYASADQGTGTLFKSTDGGHTYTLVNAGGGYQSGQGWYDNTIWVSPADPNIVVAAGLDLYESTNGGTSFTKISDWTQSWPNATPSPHADHHALVSIPGSSTAVLNGNDGGLYYTSNIATAGNNPPSYNNGWVYLNNGLGVTQFYGVSGNNNGVLYGGAQDNGVSKYTPGAPNAWTKANGGDGGKSAADPINPNYFYNEYTNGKVNRSSDGGGTAQDIYGTYYNGTTWTCRSAPYRIDDACNGTAPFIAPILLDPNNPNRLLVGGLSLWVSNDARTPYVYISPTGGPQWAAIKSSIGSGINAIAVAPGNSNIIWVGYSNSEIDMTTNGGSTWTRVDTNIGADNPGTQIGSIAIDKNDNNIVYVGFTGFGANRLWHTANGGATWTNITSNLPQAPIYAVAINPANSAWLYVGTEIGVFASVDTGTTWNVPTGTGKNGDGPANVAVFDLQWMGGGNSTGTSTLIAGTHGRGAWTANTFAPANTYADSAVHTCAGNTPCYATLADAIGTVATGGTVTVYTGTYTESAVVRSNITVTAIGAITVNDVYLYPGSVWNAGSSTMSVNNLNLLGGSVWNANSSTLTIRGDFMDSPSSFVQGSGTVIMGGITQTLQKPGALAYSNDFSSMTGWQINDANSDGTTWFFTASTTPPNSPDQGVHAMYQWNPTNQADDWLFSPGFALQAGVAYAIRFNYGAHSDSYPERLAVHIGNNQSVAAMTTQVFNNNNVINMVWQQGSGTFTPTIAGTYYVGFHAYSLANQWDVDVDDLVVTAVDSSLHFNNLTIANGSTTSIATNMTVQNNLTTNPGGILVLGTNNVAVEGAVANNGGLAQTGNINGTGVTFLNIKNAAGDTNKYFGAIITSTGNMSTTTVAISGNQNCTTNTGDQLITRCFNITPVISQSATVRFYYTYGELNNQTFSLLVPWHWNAGWAVAGNNYSRSATCNAGQLDCWVEAQNITSYSPFGLGSGSAPTAVSLQSLSASPIGSISAIGLAAPLALLGIGCGLLIWKRRRSAA